jgi:hypothetical protein
MNAEAGLFVGHMKSTDILADSLAPRAKLAAHCVCRDEHAASWLAWPASACYRSHVGALRICIDQGVLARGSALMGVLNLTPDSFYDGGVYATAEQARARIDRLLSERADLIDIGGESAPASEPGAC